MRLAEGADASGALLGREAAPVRAAPIVEALDRAIGWLTEVPAALLVVAELVVLFVGVTARYAFNQPLIWSDEVASLLFIWLSMLGAVVALRRGEHMRLSTFVMMLPQPWRSRAEALATAIGIAFLLGMLMPARDYVDDQWAVLTSALGIHESVRAAAILVGTLLMLVVSLLRLSARASRAELAGAVLTIAVVAAALWVARPLLTGMGNYNLIIFFVCIIGACIVIGLPIAFSFGIATMAYVASCTTAPLTVLVGRMEEGMSELILLSIPLFVVLGLLCEMMGLARALIDFMASLLGHVRGGLSYVLVGAIFLVSGISGSKTADMAAVAPVLFPEMKRRGSPPGELVALLSATGAMSETIPPSFVLITMGSVTGISIAALFTGGLLPAAVCAATLLVMVAIRSRREAVVSARAPLRTVLRNLAFALPALVLPLLIRFAVVEGLATATEVSTVGVIYTLLVGMLIYRRLDFSRFYPMLVATASLSGAILLIIGVATTMSWALTQSGFSQSLADFVAGAPGGKAGFIAASILVFAVLGSVLEGIPAVVLFGPLLFPASRALGIPDVHYAIIAILSMGLGLFAPPFGIGFYAACAVGGVPPDQAMRRVWPYLLAVFAGVVICAVFPWLSIGLL